VVIFLLLIIITIIYVFLIKVNRTAMIIGVILPLSSLGVEMARKLFLTQSFQVISSKSASPFQKGGNMQP